jgi:hypothetical protein
MTDDAVRFVRSGDSQVAYRVVGSAPRSRGCRGLLRVRHHDRDGSRVFVASVELPGPPFGASATVMRSKRRVAVAPPEVG